MNEFALHPGLYRKEIIVQEECNRYEQMNRVQVAVWEIPELFIHGRRIIVRLVSFAATLGRHDFSPRKGARLALLNI